MLNSVVAAQIKQNFIYRNWEAETDGNPLAHTILRGAVNKHGNAIPNYHYEDLQFLLENIMREICRIRRRSWMRIIRIRTSSLRSRSVL